MISNAMRWALLGAASLSGAAQAQVIGPTRPSVPLACSLGDLNPIEQRVVDATAYLVHKGRVRHDDVNDTYSIPTSAFTDVTVWNPDTSAYHVWNLCSSSQFYNSPVIGDTMAGFSRGRSATMIGHNLFVTAAHSLSFSAGDYYLVFMPSGFPCTVSDLSAIPADNVYKPTNFEENIVVNHTGYDFHYFHVDRSVVGRKPLKIRRSGSLELGDGMMLSGHSYWSGVRVNRFGTYHGDLPVAEVGGVTEFGPDLSDLYPYPGASGGPIFNIKDEVVETVTSGDIDGGADFSGSCFFETFSKPMRPTNGSVKAVAGLIPRHEVSVTPLDKVVHVASVGGTLSQPVTSYQLQGGLSSNQYAVDPDPSMPVSGAPALVSSIAPGDRLLSFITPTTWTLSADISAVSSCGIWEYEYNVRDRYSLQNNYVRHRFEIGVTEVEISPTTGVDIIDFGFPVTKTYSYAISNVRPTASTLNLKALNSLGTASGWMRVDGVTSKSITLQPQGQPGDAATVVVSVVEPMLGGSGSIYPDAFLQIDHAAHACVLTSEPEVVIPFKLTVGKDRFSAIASGDYLYGPTGGASYGTPESTLVEVDEAPGYCVADVNARVALVDSMGTNIDFPAAAQWIRIRLKSPLGTQVTLWDKHAVPSSAYVEAVTVPAYGQLFASHYLLLDDESTPPLVSPLSVFDGEPVEGDWEVEVASASPSATMVPIQHVLDFNVVLCTP